MHEAGVDGPEPLPALGGDRRAGADVAEAPEPALGAQVLAQSAVERRHCIAAPARGPAVEEVPERHHAARGVVAGVVGLRPRERVFIDRLTRVNDEGAPVLRRPRADLDGLHAAGDEARPGLAEGEGLVGIRSVEHGQATKLSIKKKMPGGIHPS